MIITHEKEDVARVIFLKKVDDKRNIFHFSCIYCVNIYQN